MAARHCKHKETSCTCFNLKSTARGRSVRSVCHISDHHRSAVKLTANAPAQRNEIRIVVDYLPVVHGNILGQVLRLELGVLLAVNLAFF